MVASILSRSALRLATTSTTPRSLLSLQQGARRGYAEAVSDKLKLSFILPHQAIYNSEEVTQVNIASASGDMGILASHVPSVEELRPGVLEVIESSGAKKWFVSGGFATVHPNNKLVINAIEAYNLEQFSPEAVRSALAEAQRVASSSSSAEDKAEAEIEVEVYTAIQAALAAK